MSYDVAIVGSIGVNPGYVLVNNKDYPQIADDYVRSFKTLRSLPVDVFLGAHGSFYDLTTKYAQLEKGGGQSLYRPGGVQGAPGQAGEELHCAIGRTEEGGHEMMTRRAFGMAIGSFAVAGSAGTLASAQQSAPVPAGDLCDLSAIELAARLKKRDVSARDVMAAHLARIERVNPKVNAVVTLVAERAMADAARADEALAREARSDRCTVFQSRTRISSTRRAFERRAAHRSIATMCPHVMRSSCPAFVPPARSRSGRPTHRSSALARRRSTRSSVPREILTM